MRKDLIITEKEMNGFVGKVGFVESLYTSSREWDNLGTIYSNHKHYNPDKHRLSELEDIIDPKDEGVYDFNRLDKDYIWLTVRGYEHSGMTISCGGGYPYDDPWDSGLFGVILVSKDKVRKEYNCKRVTKAVREKVLRCLEGEIETLDKEFRGEVYEFIIEDSEGEFVDGCTGYYDEDECEMEMLDALESACIEKEEEELEKKLMAMAV